jgi:hypothetical protein
MRHAKAARADSATGRGAPAQVRIALRGPADICQGQSLDPAMEWRR